MAHRQWAAGSGVVSNHIIGSEALRCPDLHDFSDLRGSPRRSGRPAILVMMFIALLTVGHFAYRDLGVAAAPIAEQLPRSTAG